MGEDKSRQPAATFLHFNEVWYSCAGFDSILFTVESHTACKAASAELGLALNTRHTQVTQPLPNSSSSCCTCAA